MIPADPSRAAEAVWRLEAPRLIAALVRSTRNLDEAEDLAQDALLAALDQWPRAGVPDRPGAWLLTVARRRAIDGARRRSAYDAKRALLIRDAEPSQDPEVTVHPDQIADDLLRLIFLTCHPALSMPARIALTLRLLAGMTTDEIARAYLIKEATVAQRLVRAKHTLADHRGAFDDLPAAEHVARLPAVLEVVYLIFNEGYAATSGASWTRPDLCGEALRLGRLLASVLPDQAEAHALLALMEFQASRLGTRTDADGQPVLLMDQDRRRWDRLLIRRGLAALATARRLAPQPGPYQLQAALASCHATALTPEDTDWCRIADLYAELARIQPSPVVELNRAVAVAHADGPGAGLAIVDELADDPQLAGYHPLVAVRADLLARLGRHAEARAAFERAAALTRNDAERHLLSQRARDLET